MVLSGFWFVAHILRTAGPSSHVHWVWQNQEAGEPVQIGSVSLPRLGKESPITTRSVWPPETLSRRQGRPSDSTLTVSQGATSWLWWCHLGRSWTRLHWLKPTCLKAFGTVSCGLQPVPPGFLLFSMVLSCPLFGWWMINLRGNQAF